MVKGLFRRSEFLLISLVFCSLTNAKQVIRLHSGLECPESGYFRDAVNCKRFYYCPNVPRQESHLNDEELLIIKEITEKGLECPDGSIFDETISSCQNIYLMDVVPPECKFPEVFQSYTETKNGLVPHISNNFH